MKQDTVHTMMFRLILATGVLLLFTWEGQAAAPASMKPAAAMKGRLEAGEKKIALLSLGDRVVVRLNDPGAVIPGDRMEIYEPSKTGVKDANGEELLIHAGRLVITEAREGLVAGQLEAAHKEIFAGSHVDYTLPETDQRNPYFTLLRQMAAGLRDPARDSAAVALLGVTNDAGEVTRQSAALQESLRKAVCGRPQFRCVDSDALRGVMESYGAGPGSEGMLLRQKVAERLSADWLVGGQAVREKSPGGDAAGELRLILTAYDMHAPHAAAKTVLRFAAAEIPPVEDPDEVLMAGHKASHGHVRIVAANRAPSAGQRVDALLLASLEAYVAREHRHYIGEGSVVLGGVEVVLDGKPLKSGPEGVYYDDIVAVGEHTLYVAAIPSLAPKGEFPIGKRMEKSAAITVAADKAYESRVVLKVVGRQALMVIDTRNMKQRAQGISANE